jgi:flagellar protein FliO/FliZ
VLGVTDQQVSLLGETELDAFVRHEHEHRDHLELSLSPDQLQGPVLSPKTWRSTMDFLRDRTTRH